MGTPVFAHQLSTLRILTRCVTVHDVYSDVPYNADVHSVIDIAHKELLIGVASNIYGGDVSREGGAAWCQGV